MKYEIKLISICKFLEDSPNWGEILIEETEEYKQDLREKLSLNRYN